jgi:hypothetical protein
MISMRVRKSNPLNAAVKSASDGGEVRRQRRPWIDHPALDDVRVRAIQR